MTRKPLFAWAIVAIVASASVGSLVAHSGLRAMIGAPAFPSKAEFDQVFADVETAPLVDPAHASADRARLGAAGLKMLGESAGRE